MILNKYLITDPCYVIPREQWSEHLQQTLYDQNYEYTYLMSLAPWPITYGEYVMLGAWDIPLGDIGFYWKNGTRFEADSGTICICVVPPNYEVGGTDGKQFGVLVDRIDQAKEVINYAIAFEYVDQIYGFDYVDPTGYFIWCKNSADEVILLQHIEDELESIQKFFEMKNNDELYRHSARYIEKYYNKEYRAFFNIQDGGSL